MRFILAFLLLTSTAYAQTKAATVSGPSSAPVGTLVELRASSDVSTNMTWLTVSDVTYKTYESNRVLVFATPKPGRYEFALVVVVVTADGKPIVSIEKTTVEITGSGPGPSPPVPPSPPEPGPLPEPDKPFGELAAIARQTAPADKRDEVRRNFTTVATMLAAGTIPDWKTFVSETATRNRASVGDARADTNHPWHRFMRDIGFKLDELSKTDKLANRQQWQAAWMAIADGLQ